MFILNVSVVVLATWLITHWIKSATSAKIREQLEKEYQEKHKRLESEFAEKEAVLKNKAADQEAALAKRERVVALQEHKLKSVDDRVRFASQTLQVAEEKERDVERREQLLAEAVDSKFAQRERELALREHNLEVIIARRVQQDIKGKQKGIDKNWEYIKREKRTLKANNEKYNEKSASLDEREQKMYERAVLIADHLGVPLKCILDRREKKLVGKIANELTEEYYALMDLVMSCPEYRVKHLLEWMQQFPRSSQR